MNQMPEEYRKSMRLAEQFLRENDQFLVVSHVHPDGDAASSTFAVGKILKAMGKTCVMVNEGEIPAKFNWLSGYAETRNAQTAPLTGLYDKVVMVDCADYERAGRIRDHIHPEAQILNIDHHPTNDRYGKIAVVKEDAAATTEILYDFVHTVGISWDRELAECIYTGILTDTGGFRYSNTSPKVMQIAADLLTYGVNAPQIAERLLESISFGQIQLLKRALSTLSFAAERQIAWMSLSMQDLADCGASREDSDGIVNYAINIEGVKVGLLFKQSEQDKVKVSFRSSGEVNVSEIAMRFGGGGHVRASGCSLKGTLDESIDPVIQSVKQELS